jgi:hypothetical protein
MALDKNFSNTVADKKDKVREITKLTELTESDKNTIFNLIFAETTNEKVEE